MYVDRYLTSLSGTKVSCLLNYSSLQVRSGKPSRTVLEYPIYLRRISCDSVARTVDNGRVESRKNSIVNND